MLRPYPRIIPCHAYLCSGPADGYSTVPYPDQMVDRIQTVRPQTIKRLTIKPQTIKPLTTRPHHGAPTPLVRRLCIDIKGRCVQFWWVAPPYVYACVFVYVLLTTLGVVVRTISYTYGQLSQKESVQGTAGAEMGHFGVSYWRFMYGSERWR